MFVLQHNESPKPRPSPRLSTGNVMNEEPTIVGHSQPTTVAQESKAEPDEGLAMLRRQPSIRDRKRVRDDIFVCNSFLS